ncbi:MAG: T9SS type A sorting domain-containing protein [Saprospiraceae bacterium]|nr:T9SS type A sorting domain-containing protein [Candidatus Brachybacter algidus]
MYPCKRSKNINRKNTLLKLINISGEILKDIKLSLDQILIDISFLTAGIYIVQIYDGSNFRVTKFIKN